ncbi:MAG: PEP-CTERM sorting domain-containing protein [Phycisphaera sp.]|nr:PEP-CTERM sorting domain-containing protein [Phycisphaera sp.]
MSDTSFDSSSREPRSSGSSRAAYSLAAGAAAAAALNAGAAIVYSGVQDISINQFNSLNLNLDGDAYSDLLLKNYVFGGGNYQGATVNFFPGKLVSFNAGGFAYASALSAGFTVDASSVGPSFFGSMAYGGANPNAQFNSASNAYLGLSFSSGANLFYGWVRVSVNNAAGTFVVHDWAYENSGAGIQTGAVPAPGALGLLAAGASGLGLLRSRKRSK